MKNILFLLFLIPNIIIAQCAGVQSATLSPLPTNGTTYEPGTVVTMCYTMDGWNGTNFGANWVEGFGINLGPGWVSYSPVTPPDDCGGASLPQQWYWMESVTNNSGTLTVGPGYFYEGPTGPTDGNPGNDWGDFGTNCLWTFCVQLQVTDQCDPLSLLIEVTPYADGTMGSWNNEACFDGPYVAFNGTVAGGNVNTSVITPIDTVCVGFQQNYSVINTPGSTYDWTLSGGGSLTENGSNNIIIDWGGVSGDYTITVLETTVDGCVGEPVTQDINVSDTIVVVGSNRHSICLSDTTKLFALPTGGYWSGENIVGNMFEGFNSGYYTPTYFVNIHGCNVSKSTELYVRPKFNKPVFETDLPIIDLCVFPNQQYYYVPDSIGFQYTWHVDGNLQLDTDYELSIFWPDSTMNHEISVYATDSIGCVSENSYLTISTKACNRLYIPNSFTPNNDGFNDAFKISGLAIYEPDMKIYNYDGSVIYEIRSLNQYWDGNDGKGYYCQNGVYNWILTYRDDAGFGHVVKGHVVLIR